jgi:hypothetical protein
MPLRKTRNSKRRSKRQSGSGFTFGLETPIGGLAQVNTYSDCGAVKVPQPMDHSVGNVVPGCAANGAEAAQNQPAANAVQTALNSGVQAGGKRKKRKSNKNKKQKKRSGKKSKAKGKAKKSKSKSKSKRSKKSRK